MKTLLKLLPLFLSLVAVAQVPPIIRNPYSTNIVGPVDARVRSISQSRTGHVAYMSPLGGGNHISNMLTNTPTFEGQLGFSYSGDRVGTLWYAGIVNGPGSNSWGYPMQIPGGVRTFGDQWYMPLHGIGRESTFFYFNGSAPLATETNIWVTPGSEATVDSYVWVANMNPWASGSSFGLKRVSTNATGGTLVGTNSLGFPIYIHTYDGLHFVTIPDAYPVGFTNQAPCSVIIPGLNYPFYISYNMALSTEVGPVGQRSLLAFDSRYTGSGIFALRVPKQVPYIWDFRQAGWLDTLFIDTLTGNLWATNGTAIFSNVFGNATAAGSYIFGNQSGGDNAGVFNINGSSVWAAPSPYGMAFTFDAALQRRLGFVVQNGHYPKLVHGTNAPLQIAISTTGSDLQSSTASHNLVTQAAFSNETFTVNIQMATSLSNSAPAGAVSVSGSPFLWTNQNLGNVHVNVSGGAVQGIGMNGSAWSRAFTNASCYIPLQPGQWIGITNTTAPLMVTRSW